MTANLEKVEDFETPGLLPTKQELTFEHDNFPGRNPQTETARFAGELGTMQAENIGYLLGRRDGKKPCRLYRQRPYERGRVRMTNSLRRYCDLLAAEGRNEYISRLCYLC